MAGQMFEDSEAGKAFAFTLTSLEEFPEKQLKFGDRVRALYDLKAISEEGTYPTFQITVDDIRRLARNL